MKNKTRWEDDEQRMGLKRTVGDKLVARGIAHQPRFNYNFLIC